MKQLHHELRFGRLTCSCLFIDKYIKNTLISYSMPKHKKTNSLVYCLNNKTELFQICHLPCNQQKIKLLAKSIKTIESIIIISTFIMYLSMVHFNLFMVVIPSKTQLCVHCVNKFNIALAPQGHFEKLSLPSSVAKPTQKLEHPANNLSKANVQTNWLQLQIFLLATYRNIHSKFTTLKLASYLLTIWCPPTFIIIIIIIIRHEAISQSILPLQLFARTVYPPLAPGPPSLLHPCHGTFLPLNSTTKQKVKSTKKFMLTSLENYLYTHF